MSLQDYHYDYKYEYEYDYQYKCQWSCHAQYDSQSYYYTGRSRDVLVQVHMLVQLRVLQQSEHYCGHPISYCVHVPTHEYSYS